MEPADLLAGRIREINGNIRVMLALLAGWAGVFWWLSLAFLPTLVLARDAMHDEGALIPIGLAMVGFVTAYITASCTLAIDRQVREMQALSKALADEVGGPAPGTAERSLYLKPTWPMPALVWVFGLHACGAGVISIVWLVLAFAALR